MFPDKSGLLGPGLSGSENMIVGMAGYFFSAFFIFLLARMLREPFANLLLRFYETLIQKS